MKHLPFAELEPPKGKEGTIPFFLQLENSKKVKDLVKKKAYLTRKGNLPYHLVKPVFVLAKKTFDYKECRSQFEPPFLGILLGDIGINRLSVVHHL